MKGTPVLQNFAEFSRWEDYMNGQVQAVAAESHDAKDFLLKTTENEVQRVGVTFEPIKIPSLTAAKMTYD